ncbi:MAG: hypothetical protein E7Z81_06135 [Methanobrevibacter sp.]|uniref:right-handed parallel beta-helix repeat-containing protein n=1 Tax=Methanobrevibacter sp. TaxID=66852 RepID=UPI0025CE85D3|nr:right-handed parallel beta-helix repeat-containing protein [Methanobrevibacter sp.]MBE6497840.1 hypothetical protein [Methanobrevibacter sp.]
MKTKLTVICLLLFVLCSLSTVCAQDINDTQITTEADSSNALDTLQTAQDTVLSDSGDDLQKIINNASEGSTVKLNNSYATTKILKIDKTITIDGAGNTIDCKNNQIYSTKGDITLKNLVFINGKSSVGGAIFIAGSATYNIINCTFINNTAGNIGGAIYNDVVATLTITNSRFINNSASVSGGAINSKGDVVVENSSFISNTVSRDGGAIHAERSVDVSNSVFNLNRAYNAVFSTYGGAINAKEEIFVNNCNFTENNAYKGGALFAYKDVVIEKSQFIKNTAKSGGAIEVSNDNHIIIEGSTFKENSASSGSGGALLSNKWVHIGNSVFEQNKASGKGGAVQAGYIQFSGKNSFINNSANDHGGAVYTDTIGNSNNNLIFTGNHADSDFGGAIYINKKSGDVTFSSSVFTNNYANAGDGGAIYSDSSSTNLILYNSTFIANHASGGKEKRYGGAVRSCGNVYVSNSTFKDNWAENYGGAIYTETLNGITNSVFISNQVKNGDTKRGGAVYINKASTLIVNGNYFESNGGATERGGAIYIDSKDTHLKLYANVFHQNYASDQGISVFNSGYYDDVSGNWWGSNGAGISNQLKEYHTVGSNSDHSDSSPLVVSLSGDKSSYVGVKTNIKVSFTKDVSYYALEKISYSSNKKGDFITKSRSGNALELIYVPSETGIHTLSFTINSQKLTFDINVTYISVYGYDLEKTYGDNKQYSATFKDKNGSLLADDTIVAFSVNNNTYTSTVSEGVAKLNANLEPGTYTVKAINNVTGESFTNKITVKPRNAVFNILDDYFTKIEGSANETVTFKIANKTFTAKTSAEGIAYFTLNVTAGNYTVEIIYNGQTIKDQITVKKQYSTVDLGLNGTSYGALLPIYTNETFIHLSNASMYSVIAENTYRYVLGSGEAFIMYNATVSNSQELTNLLRKMASADYKVDVTQINFKKNTYKVTENFWRDSEWNYLIHLTHGKIIINGAGSTLEDDYHHNFINLEPSTSIIVNNLTFKKFYRVFASSGEVYCEDCSFVENNAKFWATQTPGSVIYNKNKATFYKCVFNGNDNSGSGDATQGGVLYGDAGSITNFAKCQFVTKNDNIRAADKSMVVIYDDNWDTYDKVKENSQLDILASYSIRHINTFNTNNGFTKNLTVANNETDLTNLYEWIRGLNQANVINVTLNKAAYSISADFLDNIVDKYEWRSDYTSSWTTVFIHERSFLDINSKPVVINGNGATISMTGNHAYSDYHFAYIPKFGSLTLVNMTLIGFNSAIFNYGTFIAINCTFKDNIMHHLTRDGDYGGAIRNYGNVFCYNSSFINNGAVKGGAYFSTGKTANAVFSNCTFSGNVYKSNWAWKNNDRNDFDIEDYSTVKFVNSRGFSASTIVTEKNGLYMFRDNLNNSVYNGVVDSLASLMKVVKVIRENNKYDIINITFVKGDYGVFPNSKSMFDADYGRVILNGNGAKIFVQNPKNDDTTQFLTNTVRSHVEINNLIIEGFNIAIQNSGNVIIRNSVFNKNIVDYNFKADYGGAIVNNGILDVFNSTFTGNYAKYGGAIYNTATAKVFMSKFSDNTGYDSKSNVDIYNKDGFVEDVVIYGTAHKIVEKHPMASWKKDLIGGSIMVATAIITANIGAAISATGATLANFISMGVNAIVGGALGAMEGFIYADDNQDYSRFWGDVLKGVSRGIQYSAFGNAFNGIKTITQDKFIEFSLKQIYTKFIAKSADLAQKIAADSAKGNYNNIVFYSMFKNI